MFKKTYIPQTVTTFKALKSYPLSNHQTLQESKKEYNHMPDRIRCVLLESYCLPLYVKDFPIIALIAPMPQNTLSDTKSKAREALRLHFPQRVKRHRLYHKVYKKLQ